MDATWPQGAADIRWNRITSSLTKFLQYNPFFWNVFPNINNFTSKSTLEDHFYCYIAGKDKNADIYKYNQLLFFHYMKWTYGKKESRKQPSWHTHTQRGNGSVLLWNISTFLLNCFVLKMFLFIWYSGRPMQLLEVTSPPTCCFHIVRGRTSFWHATNTMHMIPLSSSVPPIQFWLHFCQGTWVQFPLRNRCISCHFLIPASDFFLACHPCNLCSMSKGSSSQYPTVYPIGLMSSFGHVNFFTWEGKKRKWSMIYQKL